MPKHSHDQKTLDEYTSALRERVEEKPYQALAVAAGVGLILGGGLWNHLARSLVNLGGRLVVTAAIDQLSDVLLPKNDR